MAHFDTEAYTRVSGVQAPGVQQGNAADPSTTSGGREGPLTCETVLSPGGSTYGCASIPRACDPGASRIFLCRACLLDEF